MPGYLHKNNSSLIVCDLANSASARVFASNFVGKITQKRPYEGIFRVGETPALQKKWGQEKKMRKRYCDKYPVLVKFELLNDNVE